MENAQVSLTAVTSLPCPLLPPTQPPPPLRRIWIYPSSWSAAAALADVRSSHRVGRHDPRGKLHHLKICVGCPYVFGFGYVKGHFLFNSVALRKLTLIFSGTRGHVGPQGRRSCPVNLRRLHISQFSVEL
jgi:hypothetical protein